MGELFHKTVFLLDHTYQMRESCGIALDLDSSSRNSRSGPGQQFCPSFIAPTSKSLWTCVVENTLEYSRILWDVFSDQRLIRVLLSNPQSTETLNGWEKSHQNVTFLGEAFAKSGQPLKNVGKVEVGMKSAIAALGEPTEAQLQNMKATYYSKVVNKGRVICFTSYHAETDLQDLFRSALNHHNKTDAQVDGVLPIHECEFVLVCVCPIGQERKARITTATSPDVSLTTKTEIWVTGADKLYDRVVDLIVRQHDLVVTTITGIPMKEEQNSTSSSNYDVPLFHPRMPTTGSDTLNLKWSTPTAHKGPGLGTTHPCSCACRITPVDVNSRPSTCLSNFVLSGRSVWLDMMKKGKSISHVLTAHAGEIWMHILETSRNILEDPPSISEGIGGRVTDYRIPDFVEFMRMNVLVPSPPGGFAQDIHQRKRSRRPSCASPLQKLTPSELAKARLSRKTTFWPLTMGSSMLFSVSMYVDSILSMMQMDALTEPERMEVESKIFALIAIEARGEPPPIPSPHHKKGKRDEQWRSLYNELELFLRGNIHSEAHQKVLDCFLTCRNPESAGKPTPGGNNTPMNLALSSMPLLTDSPASPPPPVAVPPSKRLRTEESTTGRLNLLDLWKRKTEKTKSVTLGNLKLYPNRPTEEKGREKSVKINESM